MGIIKKTRNTESLLFAERKVCKRILKAVPELPEEIPAFALRYKGSKRPFFRQFGWYHGVLSSSHCHFMTGMEAFFILITSPDRGGAYRVARQKGFLKKLSN